MLALLLLAAAAGLSNFAAAIGIGVSGADARTRVRIAVLFGLFEAGMPVLGLILGQGAAAGLGHASRWLGGAALIAVGVISLIVARRGPIPGGWPARRDAAAPGPARPSWGTWRVAVSALALSTDNLAAGFALGAFHTDLAVAATVFGVVSVAMSLVGLELGAKIGGAAGDRSELVASAMLIAVGAALAAGVILAARGFAMEPITAGKRHMAMRYRRQVRGLAGLAGCGLLFTALAGCGSVVASSPGAPVATAAGSTTPAAAAAAPGSSAPGSAAAASAAAASAAAASAAAVAARVGCASINEATEVTASRSAHLVEPVSNGSGLVIQRKTALVRALFGDFCAAISHPNVPPLVLSCPMDLGISYVGAFYAGSRLLARYTYAPGGCPLVTLIASGVTRSVVVAGRAAAAAPHLVADMEKVVGSRTLIEPSPSASGVFHPGTA